MRLANLRGPALINLYASWCGPCRAETPSLERAYRTLGGRVRFVAVATEDGASAALSFIEAAGVSYPAVFDFSGTLLTDLGESVLPVSLLVRADGSVAAIHLGAYSSAAAVEDAVRAAFGRPR
jgi:thiol-disulfide isomerase/thioredoxin